MKPLTACSAPRIIAHSVELEAMGRAILKDHQETQ